MSFEVACGSDHAFDTWTTRIGAWWPADHTVSGDRDAVVVLEPGVGGRIYEQTPDGREHDWGEITVWDPPGRLAYRWHLRRAATDATEVEIRFVPRGDRATRVEIEHRGWERLGDQAAARRDRNRLGWASLLPHFVSAVQPGE